MPKSAKFIYVTARNTRRLGRIRSTACARSSLWGEVYSPPYQPETTPTEADFGRPEQPWKAQPTATCLHAKHCDLFNLLRKIYPYLQLHRPITFFYHCVTTTWQSTESCSSTSSGPGFYFPITILHLHCELWCNIHAYTCILYIIHI